MNPPQLHEGQVVDIGTRRYRVRWAEQTPGHELSYLGPSEMGHDPTIVILGTRPDVQAVRRLLIATGIAEEHTAGPGGVLYGRRLDPERLIVLDSWQHMMDTHPQHRDWAYNELLCRYPDAAEIAKRIGL